jgi:hypothetical protein
MEIIEGNILDITNGVIVHQVNNRHVMGAGLALQIKRKYPKHYDDYNASLLGMGDCVHTKINERLIIVGMVAQNGYGRAQQYTSYRSFVECLKWLIGTHKIYPNIPMYMPYGIGCGLAGGSWAIIESLIEEYTPFITLIKR